MPVKIADFLPLKPAEQQLVDWLLAGYRGDCVIGTELPPETPPPKTVLRASFLRYLALGGCAACRPPETGVRIFGAYIEGDDEKGLETQGLDLEGANVPFDLAFVLCRFPDLLLLRSAKLQNLFLNGSHLHRGLWSDRLTCTGGVFLRQVTALGELRLLGAQIGGNLDCDEAQFRATGNALIADSLNCTGSVFLRQVTALGAVRLLGAQIGEGLGCDRAQFRATGNALSADRLTCTGGVFLSEITALGEVRLLGAQIGGDLICEGAKLKGQGKSLSAGNARVSGGFFLRKLAQVKGAIDLTAAQIGAICDDPTCWPLEFLLDRCRYGAFLGNDAPLTAEMRLKWLALQMPEKYGQDFEASSYEHCAKVLREMGYGGEAAKVLIEKEHLQRKARRARLAKDNLFEDAYARAIWDRLLAYTVRYGRQPLWAFAWLIGFWLFGAMIFAQAHALGSVMPNHAPFQLSPAWVECRDGPRRQAGAYPHQLACFLSQPEAASYTSFSALAYSADTLFPLVSLEIQNYWIPDNRTAFGAFARVYLWVHIAVGWGLSLLAVAGFSGIIKSDTSS